MTGPLDIKTIRAELAERDHILDCDDILIGELCDEIEQLRIQLKDANHTADLLANRELRRLGIDPDRLTSELKRKGLVDDT